MGNVNTQALKRFEKSSIVSMQGAFKSAYGWTYLLLAFLLAGCEFDNTNPGIVVSPTSGLITAENGISAQFSIVLNSKPDAIVSIAISSSNTNEGQVDTSQVSFGAANWSTPKTIVVTGVDDAVEDGDIEYSIIFSPTESGDRRYHNLSLSSISAINLDNDSAQPPPKPGAGVTVSPATSVDAPLTTSENGASVTFSTQLNSQPASNVTIVASSSSENEGTVNPASVTFTPNDWNTSKVFTVSGVDDNAVDGTVAYSVSLASQSTDQDYNGISILPVQLQNTDNDMLPPLNPGVTIDPDSGLISSENQTSSSFSVVLTSAPTANVTVNISSSNINEGLVSPASLTFTPGTWNSAQSVTVTGVDDAVVDGDVNYNIDFTVQSTDANYNGITLTPLTVLNQDNDSAAVTATPASGLSTSEDLTSANFNVVLTSQPTAEVTVTLTSSDTGEATVSPGSLTFSAANWNMPQTVTLTGVDDAVVDGAVNYTVSFAVQSGDSNYSNLTVTPVAAVNLDNDSAPAAGITIAPTQGLQTSESLSTDTFTMVLDSQPTASVTVTPTSSDTNEATVSPGSVTFTTSNWNAPQPVTLTGVDDAVVDGTVTYTISFAVQSGDSNYNNLTVAPVTATNLDNDSAGVTTTPASGLSTSEDLTSANFSVVLTSQPTDLVTVTLTSSDTSEVTVAPSSLTFTTGDWNIAQSVTLTGVDDASVDGDVTYTIALTVQSADQNYNNLTVTPVNGVNLDNETPTPAGVTVSQSTGLLTSEDITSDTFTVVLDSQPTSAVTIAVTSSNTDEATASPGSLNFTTGNWNTAQTVTLTGVDDSVVDGDATYNVTFSVASSDANYNGLAVTAVTAVNQDNDTAGINLVPASGLITSEDLTTDTFTAVLTSQPVSEVNITLTSSNTLEGTVSPGTLAFTAADWDTPQSVTVSGVDDSTVDGDVNYSISFTVLSADSNYNAMALTPVSATNQDNDTTPPPPTSYVLYIEPAIIDIAASTITGNGATQLNAMGYALTNTPPGKTPGPIIEAVVGQTTTVEVVNDHINPHRFEIEGLLTNTPELLPGETRQFQFTPTEAGVYRYGDPQLLRRALGLQGAVVVRPAGNPNTAWTGGPAFDQERTWVIADFDETWLNSPGTVDTSQYNPNYFLMNGKSGFAAKQDPASTIDGTVGETFLIRIVNAGQFDQSLHFHSNHFQIISEGGFKYTNLATAPIVTTINVKRASTAMVLFTLTQVGTFPVHVHSAQMETGNGVYLNGTATYIIGR